MFYKFGVWPFPGNNKTLLFHLGISACSYHGNHSLEDIEKLPSFRGRFSQIWL